MTVVNKAQARDEVLALIQAAWIGADCTPEDSLLYWDTAQTIPSTGAWGRAIMRHDGGEQSTLSNEVGARRFSYTGTVTVQVFTPTGDGLELSDQLTGLMESTFAGTTTTPGGVILRNARTREIGQDGVWFHAQALADFEYDIVR